MGSRRHLTLSSTDCVATPALPARVRETLVSCLVSALEADMRAAGELDAPTDGDRPAREQEHSGAIVRAGKVTRMVRSPVLLKRSE